MPRPLIAAFLSSAACLCSQGGELIIEPGPFTVAQTLVATILPEKDSILLPPRAETWADWTILSLAPHGARVAKGEVLVKFDTETLQQKIEDTRHTIATKSLTIAQAEQELTHLQSTSGHKIESLRTTARIAKEEFDYFTRTRRNAEEKSADQALDRAKQFLANQEEELRQLTKMYEADDLTEETEEIILTRQKNAVKAAAFALEMEALQHKRTREVDLPREAVDLENQNRDASLALEEGTRSIPRSIEEKSQRLVALKTELERDKASLLKLSHDLTLAEIKSPDQGWFFHGIIDNGRWTTGDAMRSLVPGGRPSGAQPFATFIPASATLSLHAATDDTTARTLSPGQSGKVVFPGREDLDITTVLHAIAPNPDTGGKHLVVLRSDWPKDFSPAIGTSAQIHLVSYHKDSAVSIPLQALCFGQGGFSVSVKLTDGKTERRPVRRGRVSGDQVEILEGLEQGQVVVIPAS